MTVLPCAAVPDVAVPNGERCFLDFHDSLRDCLFFVEACLSLWDLTVTSISPFVMQKRGECRYPARTFYKYHALALLCNHAQLRLFRGEAKLLTTSFLLNEEVESRGVGSVLARS